MQNSVICLMGCEDSNSLARWYKHIVQSAYPKEDSENQPLSMIL